MTFQKGHPCYYRGGAVKGHAPTSNAGHLLKGLSDPRVAPYSFAAPLGRLNQIKGRYMSKAKSRERECLEAIQNGRHEADLVSRYPIGMVKRLCALHEAASDLTHKDFIHAYRLVREILTTQTSEKEKDEATQPNTPTMTVEVIQGRIRVPMPGEPGAPLPPKEEGGGPEEESQRARISGPPKG